MRARPKANAEDDAALPRWSETSMATIVSVPTLGESVVEGTVGKWLVQEGQRVEREQPLVEILTDKTDSEIPSPSAGVVTKILAVEGTTLPIGGKLCEIDESAAGDAPAKPVAAAPKAAEKAAAAPAAPLAETNGGGSAEPPAASPATRKLARELGVDLATLKGTGAHGLITQDDVQRAAQPSRPAAPPSAPASPLSPPRAPAFPPGAMSPSSAGIVGAVAPTGLGEALRVLGGSANFKVPPYQPQPGDKVVPFSRRRRIIADHMVYSKLASPHVVTFAECDLHKTSTLRDQHKDALKKEGVNLTFLAFVTAAVAKALRETPALNARVLDDAYVVLKDINLGIAVETDEGLVVPVIRRADELTVKGIARAVDEIANKARTGNLTPDDLAGKTFSISNPGKKGNLVGGAIISQPNVGILRIGEIKKRVVVVERDGEDTMAIHPVMYMALSYDHRIVDGVAANAFLWRVNEILSTAQFDL
jgi:2-oxoglutarate dehydrogenase E2 component (dihydrolipoamide succinyltransferase)